MDAGLNLATAFTEMGWPAAFVIVGAAWALAFVLWAMAKML